MRFISRAVSRFFQLLVRRPILFFAIITTCFGLGFTVLIPPFQNPDEFVHFTRAYEVSYLKMPQRFDRGKVDLKGSSMPASLYTTYKETKLHRKHGDVASPQANKYTWSQTAAAFRIPLNKSAQSVYDTASSPAYVPLIYAPQALVIKLLDFCNAPAIAMLYATRLVGLAIWVVLGSLALCIVRPVRHRLALAGVLTLPMFVAQAAAPNTEALLTGATVLFLAFISKILIEKQPLTPKRIVLLAGLLLAMVIAKPVYLAVGILALALPRTNGRRGILSYAPNILILLIPFVMFIGWSLVTRDTGGDPIYVNAIAGTNADPSAQVGYLVPNIFNFVQPFINSLLLGWGDIIFVSFIGVFGELDTPLPLLFVALGYLVIAVAIFAHSDRFTAERGENLIFGNRKVLFYTFSAAAVYVIGVYLGMYIFSTPAREKVVIGVQGRYLLPLVPLLVLFISKHQVIVRDFVYRVLLTALPAIILITSIIVVYLRYYTQYPN